MGTLELFWNISKVLGHHFLELFFKRLEHFSCPFGTFRNFWNTLYLKRFDYVFESFLIMMGVKKKKLTGARSQDKIYVSVLDGICSSVIKCMPNSFKKKTHALRVTI